MDAQKTTTNVNATAPPRRLLLPVDATAPSRRGVRHALRRAQAGEAIEVCLLHVGETVRQWEVLRFRTPQEIARFQSERAQVFLDEAARPLRAAGIASRAVFVEGDVVPSILDQAEQLACAEIVLPVPAARWRKLLSTDVVREVIARSARLPSLSVVTVDEDGAPAP